MSRFTIFGGTGFIGRHMAAAMRSAGQPVSIPLRDAPIESLGPMGHIVYCVGLTADFRSRPYDTMEAHVGLLGRILERGQFESLLYLSSTRIYDGAHGGSEDMTLNVAPWAPNDLYNLSKLSGEALCLNHECPRVRVARISNVYGERMYEDGIAGQNFLGSVILQAVRDGHIMLQTAAGSAKDYIHINDVVRALAMIAIDGEDRLYNVASGQNLSHEHLLDRLSEITGCSWSTAPDAPLVGFPRISTTRIEAAFANAGVLWDPAGLTDALPELVLAARRGSNHTEGAVA